MIYFSSSKIQKYMLWQTRLIINIHSIAYIAYVTIQILTYSQKNRECYFFIFPKLCHRTSCDI